MPSSQPSERKRKASSVAPSASKRFAHFSRRTESLLPSSVPTSKPTRNQDPRRTGSGASCRSAPHQPGLRSEQHDKWLGKDDPDTQPPQRRFQPMRKPGTTIDTETRWSPLQLFQFFFSGPVVQTVIQNTNKMAQKLKAAGKMFCWKQLTAKEFFQFLSVVIFCGLVRCPSKDDYWRKLPPFSFSFPASVMSRNRFNAIYCCLHFSDPDKDDDNDKKRGTPQYDKLFKVKPLYKDIMTACKALYHPEKQLSVDERMVATKARFGTRQCLPFKPTKWGIKLFVLTDVHGYTWNYFIYEGKTPEQLTEGLGYSAVMRLLEIPLLGKGYEVYMDSFYTSPKLLTDLDSKLIMACGAVQETRRGFPRTKVNKLPKKAQRGDIRWFRSGRLLFVQWMDTRQVSVLSNFHKAFSGLTAPRRVRGDDGDVTRSDVPIPDAVKDYNTYMGEVDSDVWTGYSSSLQKTMKWYKKIFYHLVDIAVVNSYILHKQLVAQCGDRPLTQNQFCELLITNMAGTESGEPTTAAQHVTCAPVYPSSDSTKGRKACVACKSKTPVICRKCKVSLCILPKRNCYVKWHDGKS